MLSLPETSTTSRLILLCSTHLLLLHLLLLLSSSGVGGATLRGSDSQRAPNVDMLKALEYIESLRQRSGSEPQQQPLSAGYDAGRMDDVEKLHAVLRLAAKPALSKDEDEEGEEDKSEELLQAVLGTLQQTEKASRPPEADGARGGALPRVQEGQRSMSLHKKLPLMFEDEEEDEGPEVERESHFKRTNENVEEKYTPQNLATLQSVFDELDKMTGVKTVHKRQEEEDEDDEEEDDDALNVRNVAYDDVAALDWGPLRGQEEEEEEEEEQDDKQEADRGLDYVDDNDEDVVDEDEEEDEDESYPVKRSTDPDDVSNLEDFYLLKVLEKTEEEVQKREIEEEEEEEDRAERRAAQYGEEILPRTIYEFLQISQKYQIPPEDLMDMLKNGELTRQRGAAPKKLNKLARVQNQLSQMSASSSSSSRKTHTKPEFYSTRQKSPEELRTEEILRILGLGGSEDQRPPVRIHYRSSLPRLQTPPLRRLGESAPTQQQQQQQRRLRFPGTLKDDYDTAATDEEQLAAYLAARMPARYLKPTRGRNIKGSRQREEAGPRGKAGSFEQAVQDYLDHMDSDKSPDEKRQSEDGEMMSAGAQMPGLEKEAVMKLLSFLNPEPEESESEAKTEYK